MKKTLLFCIAAFLISIGDVFAQGTTTASIRGRITDVNGEALPGATVLALHNPTGSKWGNITDVNGYFRLPNVNVGGPYTITVSFVGYEDYEERDIYLTLGQTYNFNAKLGEAVTQLEEVVVVVDNVFDGNRTGQQTVVGEQVINSTPTVSRSIADFARLNPMVSIGEGGDGFSISIAGQNNRYNTIYIDGAVNNDVFGLAGSGTNGGQTGVQPISIDAIEQFQVAVAPFDVRQSGFAGGSINAITRSGTNDFEGSAYYFWRNENLAGKTPLFTEDTEREKLAPFTAKTYGVRLGGPIIKDKLFFFANAEIQRDETPQPFDVSTYDGNANADTLQLLRNFLIENYDYDPGTYDNNTAFLNSEKFLAKIDWNINENHKLSVRHSYVRAENLEARRSSPGFIGFRNGSEYFISTTNSSALELKSIFGNNMANKLTIGSTIVRDDRDPFGSDFPTIRISDGNGSIEMGAERFSTANLLNQDIITINDNFELFKGKHSWLFGMNFEYYNVGNLFIRENYGSYRFFDGPAQFLGNLDANGNPISSRIERSFSQVDNVSGDESDAIAAFKQILLGFYVQDEVQLNDKLKLTGGLRVDIPVFLDDVPLNEGFNDTTIAKIEAAGYDMKGAQTGSFIDPQLLFSPRVGFNYDIKGDRSTQLRGGVGLFTSRIPLVWQGGAFNNYGFNIGGGRNNNEPFNPDVQDQWPGDINLNNPVPSGQIDLFASDFKLPQVLKVNLAVDQKLPWWGLVGSVDVIYSKFLNYIRYENLNLRPSTSNLTGGPDDRPLFDAGDPIEPTYTGIFLASNTNVGYSWNFAATLTKPFDNGFQGSLSYSWSDSYTLFDGTSSQNNSQWRGYYNVDGRNDEGPAYRSAFAAGHRVIGQISYRKEYLDFGASEIGLIYNGQSGSPYTYVVGAFNDNFVNDDGFDFNELAYVPENANQINLTETTVDGRVYSAAEQWDILDSFISDDRHLSDRRGDYTERNGNFLPFEHIIDLRFLQEVYVNVGDKRNTLQFSVDIFNFTNLLNEEWGKIRNFGFGTYSLYNLEGYEADGTTPIYSVNDEILQGDDIYADDLDDSGFRSSRWQMQLGIRYIFN